MLGKTVVCLWHDDGGGGADPIASGGEMRRADSFEDSLRDSLPSSFRWPLVVPASLFPLAMVGRLVFLSLQKGKRSRSLVFRCQGFFPRFPCFVVHRLDSIEKGNRITQDSINVFYDVRDYFENPRQDFHFFLFDGPQILFSFAKKKPTASFTCLFIVYQLNSIEKGNRITQESLDVLYDASDSL